jgi:ectoine hydroxylase-related dioxygenase (phytanoyl-CoA dioxygenase family)
MDGFARFGAAPVARMDVNASIEEQLATLRGDGVLVLENALTNGELKALESELDFWFERAPGGEGAFFGRRTRRFGALMAKARSAINLVLHERILALSERLLIASDQGPAHCDNIQLNISQGIGIGPGEPEQVIHRDQDLFWVRRWPAWRPGFEVLVNALYCIDDFTIENGATRFVPGSCRWDLGRWPEPHEIVQAEAKAGSAILWVGSMMHGGGANKTERIRRGAVISYNLGWLQPGEKSLLSIPRETARRLPRRAQQLIGYQVHRPTLGWVEGRDPIEWLNDEFTSFGQTQDHLCPEQVEIVENYYRQGGSAGSEP